MKLGFICPCCGWDELTQRAYENLVDLPVPKDLVPPYSEYYGMPSYEVCGCCGFEFGNDDEPGTGPAMTFQAYLAQWIANGSIWFSTEKRPPEWTLMEQNDLVILKAMKREIDVAPTSDLDTLAERIIKLRDSLEFEDANWYHALTQHIATLDSAATFNPANDAEERQLRMAIEKAMFQLSQLLDNKLLTR